MVQSKLRKLLVCVFEDVFIDVSTPERKLLVAIIARALIDLFSKDQPTRRTALFFFTHEPKQLTPFSFAWIAEVLCRDAELFKKKTRQVLYDKRVHKLAQFSIKDKVVLPRRRVPSSKCA